MAREETTGSSINRYAAAGINNDAHDVGLRIAVLADSARGSRAAFDEIAAYAHSARIRRPKGREHIYYPSGGTIAFHRNVDSLRGVSADIIYLDGDAERQLHQDGTWEALNATLAGSRNPQIIRA